MRVPNVLDTHSLFGFIIGFILVLFIHLTTFSWTAENKIKKRFDNSDFSDGTVPRILCWIPTTPKNYKNRTVEVQETWGHDCDVMLFFSELSDVTVPVIGLGVPEGRKHLINKTREALTYIYQNYYDKADWFLKADDDSYVFVDNLRHFLSRKNPDSPFYYGSVFITENVTYNSGGGGYVFGRQVLQKIVTNFGKTTRCIFNKQAEDKGVGACLESLGVVPGDSTDQNGLEVFHWSSLSMFGRGPEHAPDWAYDLQPFWRSPNIVSNDSATFHYMGPDEMRVFHYLTKLLKVIGHHRHTWY